LRRSGHFIFYPGDAYMTNVAATVDAGATAGRFDYQSEAELFPTRARKTGRQPLGYKRFARAADAIRFAIEDLPPALLVGAFLQVDDQRFDVEGIRRLYEASAYPLPRRRVPVSQP
jgi:hypothetical protein